MYELVRCIVADECMPTNYSVNIMCVLLYCVRVCVVRVQKLMEAREKEDAEAFTAALNEYDQVTRLDPWLTTLLLRVKRSFEGLAALQ